MTVPSQPSPATLYEEFYGPGIFNPLSEVVILFADPRPGEQALDLACGTGMIARRLAPRVGREGRVLAMDINPKMLEVARETPVPDGAPIEWRESDACDADLPADTFDLAICQQGLQFFPDQAGALGRVREGLKPGGRLVVATWRGIDDQTLMEEFVEVEARHLAPLGVPYEDLIAPFSLGEPGELAGLLETAGFADVMVTTKPFEACFPATENFAWQIEAAYAAVIPAFAEDQDAFLEYADAVQRDTREIVQKYTDQGEIRFPMPTNLAVGYA